MRVGAFNAFARKFRAYDVHVRYVRVPRGFGGAKLRRNTRRGARRSRKHRFARNALVYRHSAPARATHLILTVRLPQLLLAVLARVRARAARLEIEYRLAARL